MAVKYKKKIELMVRKPEKDPEELEEPLADCPFCNMPGPETELQCISCQNILPFDLATGEPRASGACRRDLRTRCQPSPHPHRCDCSIAPFCHHRAPLPMHLPEGFLGCMVLG